MKAIQLYKSLAASGLISSFGLVPPACRFLPTCSDYAVGSLQKHGPLRGTVFFLKRLTKCHPMSAGGWDPIP